MRISARARLSLLFSAIFSGLLVLSSVVIYLRVSRSLSKDFRSELIHDGRIMAELFKEELKLNALDEFAEETKEFGFDLQVLNIKNKVIVESEGWKNLGLTVDEPKMALVRDHSLYEEIKVAGKSFAVFSRPIHIPGRGDFLLRIARSQESLQKIPRTLLQWMLIIEPFMLVIAAFAGYLLAGRLLRSEERAFERLKNFTADASHELRIPLTSLRGSLEVALRKDRPAEEYRETIANALEDAEHLSHLTQDLLLFAQADENQIKLNVQDVNLKSFMEETFHQAASLPDEKQIRKTLFPPPDVMVKIDPERVRQMVFILMDNATKYGKQGGDMLVKAEVAGEKLTISVRDNGIGISAEERDKVFDRFYRVDKARSRQQGGMGLGLSIAQWIANAHGGLITLDSKQEEGSTFTVVLPR